MPKRARSSGNQNPKKRRKQQQGKPEPRRDDTVLQEEPQTGDEQNPVSVGSSDPKGEPQTYETPMTSSEAEVGEVPIISPEEFYAIYEVVKTLGTGGQGRALLVREIGSQNHRKFKKRTLACMCSSRDSYNAATIPFIISRPLHLPFLEWPVC
jgi:hypothetical protein